MLSRRCFEESETVWKHWQSVYFFIAVVGNRGREGEKEKTLSSIYKFKIARANQALN